MVLEHLVAAVALVRDSRLPVKFTRGYDLSRKILFK
jgi:hypothetical protein